MLTMLTPRRATLAMGLVALVTILGAWIFEYFGYLPCELCLMQRYAYYIVIPLALVLAALNPRFLRMALVLLALIWVASAIFGVYHAGVEWGWWQGPQTCTADAGGLGDGLGDGSGLPDLNKRGVMCNEAALRILGLSLAGWNAIISTALAWLGFAAARQR
ncbi:MAG: disulfide bond formation protein B [Hyphomicrobiales bacterium]